MPERHPSDLLDYLYEELSPERMAEARAHIASCPECLEELKRILEGVGLKVNVLFGHESRGVEEWKEIPKAQFNLVLSPWLGVSVARHLEKKYGQTFLHVPAIPDINSTFEKTRETVQLALDNLEPLSLKVDRELYHTLMTTLTTFGATVFPS